MKKIFFSLVLLAVVFAPVFVFAAHTGQGLVPCGYDLNHNGEIDKDETCKLCHLFQLINNIVNWVLLIIIPIIAPIFIVIGGIYLLIARGDPTRFTQGKNVLTAAIIGLIIVYTGWVVLMTILNSLGVAPWTGLGSWWQIECPT